jgi:hypothetical protein
MKPERIVTTEKEEVFIYPYAFSDCCCCENDKFGRIDPDKLRSLPGWEEYRSFDEVYQESCKTHNFLEAQKIASRQANKTYLCGNCQRSLSIRYDANIVAMLSKQLSEQIHLTVKKEITDRHKREQQVDKPNLRRFALDTFSF